MRSRARWVVPVEDSCPCAAGTLQAMARQQRENSQGKKKRSTLKDLVRLVTLTVAVIAIVKELRKPAEERTWHGKVGDFIPYDFRVPTVERLRDTYWNPDGPFLSAKAFGVGWAPNFGVLKRLTGG